MDAVELLGHTQALLFVVLAVIAVGIWQRQRERAPALLAAAFVTMATVLVISRVSGGDTPALVQVLQVALLGSFPWLLAAFAYSFERDRLPPWLWAGAVGIGALTLWLLVASPLDGPGAARTAFLVGFIGLWLVHSLVAARHLAKSGGALPVVRSRMRLLASAVLVLTAVLLVSANVPAESRPVSVQLAITLLVVVSGLLFLLGFVPPTPLRLWWRRGATSSFMQLQTELIRAVTPTQVAHAAAPRIAAVLGGGVAVIATDGTVLATSGFDRQDAYELARRLLEGEQLEPHILATAMDAAWLVVHTTPYTPVFGQDEHDLVEAYATHVSLAFERAELYTQSVRSREELEAMLLGLAHDLRSPAVAVDGFAQLLPSATTDEEREAMLEGIRGSAGYLNQLVDALLELSSVGRSRTEVEPVQLADLAREAAGRTNALHPEATIDVVGDAPRVTLNPVRAAQVIDNLLGNAVKHGGRPDLAVTVQVQPLPDGGVEMTVADDGVGISEADRDKVFALFHRGRTATSRGSGLGLGLVRRIAESVGGTVALVDTDGPGTCFAVRFPPTAVAPETAAHG